MKEHIQRLEPDAPPSSWIARVAGIAGALVTLLLYFGLERIFQDVPARHVIRAMSGSTNTLCFAGITASATIMPLLLTIFSFARRSKVEFDPWFYQRIKNIGLLCCLAFIAGLVNLIILSAPVADDQSVNAIWYTIFYYIIIGGLSVMVGTLVSILVMLYHAIIHVIGWLNPHTIAERDSG